MGMVRSGEAWVERWGRIGLETGGDRGALCCCAVLLCVLLCVEVVVCIVVCGVVVWCCCVVLLCGVAVRCCCAVLLCRLAPWEPEACEPEGLRCHGRAGRGTRRRRERRDGEEN